MSEDLEKTFDCQVHIHKGSAFVFLGNECKMGAVFPGNNVISDILLLVFGEIQERIAQQKWKVSADETCVVDEIDFERMLLEVKQNYGSGFTKNYREMSDGEFLEDVVEQLKRWMFIKKRHKERQIVIYPAVGKMKGSYPYN